MSSRYVFTYVVIQPAAPVRGTCICLRVVPPDHGRKHAQLVRMHAELRIKIPFAYWVVAGPRIWLFEKRGLEYMGLDIDITSRGAENDTELVALLKRHGFIPHEDLTA